MSCVYSNIKVLFHGLALRPGRAGKGASMIASVRGVLLVKGADHVVVEVGGLGVKVHVPASLVERLGTVGDEVTLSTHLLVREDDLSLYGFATGEELKLFEMLLRVSGIGPRTAMGMMSALAPESLKQAIAAGDVVALSRIPGLGKKTAERLVLDLRDKVGAVAVQAAMPFSGLTVAEAEVMAALTSLGYSAAEAQQAVRALPAEQMTLEEKILSALRSLSTA